MSTYDVKLLAHDLYGLSAVTSCQPGTDEQDVGWHNLEDLENIQSKLNEKHYLFQIDPHM